MACYAFRMLGRFAVLGWPIAHSRSPALLAAAFAERADMPAMDRVAVPPFTTPLELRARLMAYDGCSITMPHKLLAYAVCDNVSDVARATGAVNCVARRDGRLWGTNTDVHGFLAALDDLQSTGPAHEHRPENALAQSPARAVILGAGGAARAVAHAFTMRHVDVTIAARTASRAAWAPRVVSLSDIEALLPTCDVLIDATSAALADGDAFADMPLVLLPPSACVMSLVYGPQPGLVRAALACGLRATDGKRMLAHQAILAYEAWGLTPDVASDRVLGSGAMIERMMQALTLEGRT